MQISGWLLFLQQTAGAMCILASMSAAGAPLPARRILPFSLTLGLFGVWGALSGPTLRLLLLPSAFAVTLLALPRAARCGAARTLAGTALAFAGLARALAALQLPAFLIPLLMPLAVHPLRRRSHAAPTVVPLVLTREGRSLRTTALVDSGNLLHDPLTGLPVIVLPRRTAMRFMTLPASGELSPGMRLLSIRTAAGRSLLTLVRADRILIRQMPVDAILGLTDDDHAAFDALVPASILPTDNRRRSP